MGRTVLGLNCGGSGRKALLSTTINVQDLLLGLRESARHRVPEISGPSLLLDPTRWDLGADGTEWTHHEGVGDVGEAAHVRL